MNKKVKSQCFRRYELQKANKKKGPETGTLLLLTFIYQFTLLLQR